MVMIDYETFKIKKMCSYFRNYQCCFEDFFNFDSWNCASSKTFIRQWYTSLVSRFFNFGGQVKKKPGSTSGGGVALSRRRGSDRSLSGSAHELAVCAAQPPRGQDQPSHSHSQSNLTDIPFR